MASSIVDTLTRLLQEHVETAAVMNKFEDLERTSKMYDDLLSQGLISKSSSNLMSRDEVIRNAPQINQAYPKNKIYYEKTPITNG